MFFLLKLCLHSVWVTKKVSERKKERETMFFCKYISKVLRRFVWFFFFVIWCGILSALCVQRDFSTNIIYIFIYFGLKWLSETEEETTLLLFLFFMYLCNNNSLHHRHLTPNNNTILSQFTDLNKTNQRLVFNQHPMLATNN